uniref:GAF domain-containing protein n=1 Tax=Chromera velia CCMP2878 TaxID=1169474 RepID=A0A0G4FIV7_9ALVE|eukprot:Cvel_17278.t1-p1 / transcript=Cvel_17278.t1 / gene=Cvel_17278 / organism=Chromera_velia_CCMP2878 / gene_product=hypothetical protein / transcript_product=hypothetical protein / location=Cvel_scaffold1370:26980-37680(-) / protein_length=1187 / sequence_SO=supercontig / SO=protein_coding / is_pseudo=false
MFMQQRPKTKPSSLWRRHEEFITAAEQTLSTPAAAGRADTVHARKSLSTAPATQRVKRQPISTSLRQHQQHHFQNPFPPSSGLESDEGTALSSHRQTQQGEHSQMIFASEFQNIRQRLETTNSVVQNFRSVVTQQQEEIERLKQQLDSRSIGEGRREAGSRLVPLSSGTARETAQEEEAKRTREGGGKWGTTEGREGETETVEVPSVFTSERIRNLWARDLVKEAKQNKKEAADFRRRLRRAQRENAELKARVQKRGEPLQDVDRGKVISGGGKRERGREGEKHRAQIVWADGRALELMTASSLSASRTSLGLSGVSESERGGGGGGGRRKRRGRRRKEKGSRHSLSGSPRSRASASSRSEREKETEKGVDLGGGVKYENRRGSVQVSLGMFDSTHEPVGVDADRRALGPDDPAAFCPFNKGTQVAAAGFDGMKRVLAGRRASEEEGDKGTLNEKVWKETDRKAEAEKRRLEGIQRNLKILGSMRESSSSSSENEQTAAKKNAGEHKEGNDPQAPPRGAIAADAHTNKGEEEKIEEGDVSDQDEQEEGGERLIDTTEQATSMMTFDLPTQALMQIDDDPEDDKKKKNARLSFTAATQPPQERRKTEPPPQSHSLQLPTTDPPKRTPLPLPPVSTALSPRASKSPTGGTPCRPPKTAVHQPRKNKWNESTKIGDHTAGVEGEEIARQARRDQMITEVQSEQMLHRMVSCGVAAMRKRSQHDTMVELLATIKQALPHAVRPVAFIVDPFLKSELKNVVERRTSLSEPTKFHLDGLHQVWVFRPPQERKTALAGELTPVFKGLGPRSLPLCQMRCLASAVCTNMGNSKVLAVIQVHSQSNFTVIDSKVLQTLCNCAGAVMARMQAHRGALMMQYRVFSCLEICATLYQCRGFPELEQMLQAQLKEFFQVETVRILFFDASDGSLLLSPAQKEAGETKQTGMRFKEKKKYTGERLRAMRLPLNAGLVGQCVDRMCVLYVPDLTEEHFLNPLVDGVERKGKAKGQLNGNMLLGPLAFENPEDHGNWTLGDEGGGKKGAGGNNTFMTQARLMPDRRRAGEAAGIRRLGDGVSAVRLVGTVQLINKIGDGTQRDAKCGREVHEKDVSRADMLSLLSEKERRAALRGDRKKETYQDEVDEKGADLIFLSCRPFSIEEIELFRGGGSSRSKSGRVRDASTRVRPPRSLSWRPTFKP